MKLRDPRTIGPDIPEGLKRVIGIGAALYFFGTMAVAGLMLTTTGG